MRTPSSTVTIWESGRLVAAPSAPPVLARFSREQWIGAALLVSCAVVMALYVSVLQRDVNRADLQHDEMRARAVAEGKCESTHAADARGACLAILQNGDTVAATGAPPDTDAAPPNDVYDSGARMATSSMGAVAGMAGIAQ